MIVSQEVGICICFKRSDIVNFPLKTNVVRERRCNVVILGALIVVGRVVKWEGGKGEKVVNWCGGKVEKVGEW